MTQEPRLRGAATAWKRENQRELQEDHWAGNHEASSRNFQQVTRNEEIDLVEGSASSKVEKEAALE
jgi:predicted phosphohydrolase